jgi:hypothetical protein
VGLVPLAFVPDDAGVDMGGCFGSWASGDGDGQPALKMPNPGKVGHVGRSITLPVALDDVGFDSATRCSDTFVGSSGLLQSALEDCGNNSGVGNAGVGSRVWIAEADCSVSNVGANSAIGDTDCEVGDVGVNSSVGGVGVNNTVGGVGVDCVLGWVGVVLDVGAANVEGTIRAADADCVVGKVSIACAVDGAVDDFEVVFDTLF